LFSFRNVSLVAGSPHRFVVLDSWRGLAALAVAWHHIEGTAPFLAGTLHANLALAVDFFFVLSGFVIAASYGERLAGGFPLARFMALRIGRVWPLHAAMVLLYLLLETGLWLMQAGIAGREPFTGPRDLAALPVSLFLLQAWFLPGRDLWNVQSWSISVELGLYLGAALLWRFGRGRAFLVAPLLGFAALAVLAAGEGGVWVQVLRGLGGFGLGMACWPLWQALNARSWPRLPLVLAELALPPLILWALAADVPLIGLDLLFAAAVLVFAGERGPVSAALRTAPMVWLGTLSYALYMVHGLVFGRVFDVMAAVQGRVGGEWVAAGLGGGDRLLLAPLQSALAVAAMMALALVAAWLAWRLVEWPARAWSRRLAARIGSNGANSAATRV
jgi:peptidoglycan/LPS O-acetylase OafA/YrhL